MYAVCARLQRAPLVEAPLRDGDDDFSVDLGEVAELAEQQSARLVFLCSPGNPAGGPVSAEAVLDLARRLRGQALVVVDEAYIEFADVPSLVVPAAAGPNIVRSEEHTSELQSLMRISYAVFCLKKKKQKK